MNPRAAGGERFEVYRYVWPLPIWMLIWSGVAAISVAGTVLWEAELRQSIGNMAWPIAIGLGMYGAAVVCAYRFLDKFEGFRRLAASPSLVADREGLKTSWSLGSQIPRCIPWKEIRGFGIGTRSSADDGSYAARFPCVLVSDIKRYRRWFSGTIVKWEPANALPLPSSFTLGYLVRCDPSEPQDNVDNQGLVKMLSDFKSDMATVGVGGGLKADRAVA